jgi:hypothetical protein
MNEYLLPIYTWLISNPEIWVPVLVYLAWNIIPRTPPADRRLFALWSVAERLMVLSWDRWGGKAKSLGIVSPDPVEWADEAVTKKEGKP